MKNLLNSIRAIALNTFREAIRDRILYALLLFALLMIMGSVLLGNLSIGGELKIVKDMGLASISIFGMLIAIFIGVGLISKEIERKTIYTILTKPISRHLFILAKFLGLALVLLFEVLVMALGLLALVFVLTHSLELILLKAIFLIYLELLLITAIAILFSCFSTSAALSGLFCLAFYAVGHLSGDIKTLGARSTNLLVRIICEGAYYLLPNLENFNIKSQVVFNLFIPNLYLVYCASYALLYIVIILFITMAIFSAKDFT